MCLLGLIPERTALEAAPEIDNHPGAANLGPGEATLPGRLDGGGGAAVLIYSDPVDSGASADAGAEVAGSHAVRASSNKAAGMGWDSSQTIEIGRLPSALKIFSADPRNTNGAVSSSMRFSNRAKNKMV